MSELCKFTDAADLAVAREAVNETAEKMVRGQFLTAVYESLAAGRMPVLVGPSGVGKTYITHRLRETLAKSGISLKHQLFHTGSAWRRHVDELPGWRADVAVRTSRFGCDVLAIDELGRSIELALLAHLGGYTGGSHNPFGTYMRMSQLLSLGGRSLIGRLCDSLQSELDHRLEDLSLRGEWGSAVLVVPIPFSQVSYLANPTVRYDLYAAVLEEFAARSDQPMDLIYIPYWSAGELRQLIDMEAERLDVLLSDTLKAEIVESCINTPWMVAALFEDIEKRADGSYLVTLNDFDMPLNELIKLLPGRVLENLNAGRLKTIEWLVSLPLDLQDRMAAEVFADTFVASLVDRVRELFVWGTDRSAAQDALLFGILVWTELSSWRYDDQDLFLWGSII